jgi:hypothetical protein
VTSSSLNYFRMLLTHLPQIVLAMCGFGLFHSASADVLLRLIVKY